MSVLYKLQKRNKNIIIGCPVPYCRTKKGSWWICTTCHSDVCKKHEYFNGRIVRYCAICCPQLFRLITKEDNE